MKILCETQIVNRQTQSNKTSRAVKSTLAIGYKVLNNDAKGNSKKELEIINFTPQNKSGTRYKVLENIEKIFTKFVADGKATISFKTPPENLLIKSEPILLKGFLNTLKLGMQGKETFNLRLNIAAATGASLKSQSPHRMIITKRSEYPVKGFPRTVKSLTINNIELHKVGFGICSLRNLTMLNVNINNITKLPPEIGRLALTEIHISSNALGKTDDWQWLRGQTLRNSLLELDISLNTLYYFPSALIKLDQLVTLNLNGNHIKRLPAGIRRLRNLRFLCVAGNELESLPSTFSDMNLQGLDIWDNPFQPRIIHMDYVLNRAKAMTATATPLWLLAARVALKYRLPYSNTTLPWHLVDSLLELPKCACGKLCNNGPILSCAIAAKLTSIKNLVYNRQKAVYEDIVLCGQSCAGRKKLLRHEG